MTPSLPSTETAVLPDWPGAKFDDDLEARMPRAGPRLARGRQAVRQIRGL